MFIVLALIMFFSQMDWGVKGLMFILKNLGSIVSLIVIVFLMLVALKIIPV